MTGAYSSSASEVHVARDAEQARLLADSRTKVFLSPFVGRERTVSQAASDVGVGLGTMYYRVRTFLAVGLLRVAREEKRAGRAVKHYRTVGDAFFVPFELTPHADLEERLIAQLEPVWHMIARAYARVLHENESSGLYIYRDDAGTVWTRPAADRFGQPAPPTLHAGVHDVTLNLTAAQAEELAGQLSALFERYQRLEQDAGARPYLLQTAFTPVDPAEFARRDGK